MFRGCFKNSTTSVSSAEVSGAFAQIAAALPATATQGTNVTNVISHDAARSVVQRRLCYPTGPFNSSPALRVAPPQLPHAINTANNVHVAHVATPEQSATVGQQPWGTCLLYRECTRGPSPQLTVTRADCPTCTSTSASFNCHLRNYPTTCYDSLQRQPEGPSTCHLRI